MSNTTEKREFRVLENGNYNLIVDSMTIEESKKTKGCRYAKTTFKVSGGDNEGKKIWEIFVLRHPTSEKAVEIGSKHVDSLLKAAGEGSLGDLNGDLIALPNLVVGKEVVGYVSKKIQNDGSAYDGKEFNKAMDFKPAF